MDHALAAPPLAVLFSAPAHRSVQHPLIDMCLGVMPLSLRGVSRRDAFQSAANLGRIGSALLAQPRTQVDVSPVPEDTSTGLSLACLPVRIKTRQGGLEVATARRAGEDAIAPALGQHQSGHPFVARKVYARPYLFSTSPSSATRHVDAPATRAPVVPALFRQRLFILLRRV